MTDNLMEFENITKRFGGTVALDDVSFGVKRARVTGLVGENGAGKSTLVKICHGIHDPTEGDLYFDGQKMDIKNPRHAESLGISVVHQELPICENMDVKSNIFLGPDLPGGKLFPDRKKMQHKTKELFDRLDVEIDPGRPVRECSIGEQQIIMIAKAINKNAKIILMDEPTSALSPREVDILYSVIENLKEEGIAVLFISHRLEEVLKISDEICVLKDGQFVDKITREEATEQKLIRMMVGRDVKFIEREEKESASDEVVLRVENLSNEDLGIEDISFELRSGEILGFAGLRGAGRTELAQTIIGYHEKDSGEVYLEGEKLKIDSPADAINNGIGYLTEERGSLGLFFNFDIKSNISILRIEDMTDLGLVKRGGFEKLTRKQEENLNIVMNSPSQMVSELSGGNQQKVLLGRWLAAQPKVLILDEPTRGIDVGTKTEIRELIINLADMGYSIIMISSEMLEVMNIADRILVFSEGRLSEEFSHSEATEEKIMSASVSFR